MSNLRDDGYKWQQGLISNPRAWTLVDPDGHHVAHVYQASSKTWCAVWAADDGGTIAFGLASSGAAIRATDDVARPCAYVDTHDSHGIVPCDNDRVPGSPYCAPHKARVERDDLA